MGVQFHYELTAEGAKKRQAMRNLPQAYKRQLTVWFTETERDLKRSAALMQKSGKGKKTSQMGRNIGRTIQSTGDGFLGAVGTGLGNTQSVKYASNQDKGGTTHPTVTKRMRYWAWAMFYKTRDEKFKFIALTKKDKLTVNIPESRWFSKVIDDRRSLLDEMMSDVAIYRAAEKMGG